MPRSPRKLGRPPLSSSDPSVTLTLRLPSKDYDELCRRALQAQRSVAEQVRRELARPSRERES